MAKPDKATAIMRLIDIVFSPSGRRCVLTLKFEAGLEAKTRAVQKYLAFYVMARDGSQARLLGRTGLFTREESNDHFPLVLHSVVWSRDGRRIGLFASTLGKQSFTICGADGRNARRVPIPALSS